jgi:retron-type reverse transcriptase
MWKIKILKLHSQLYLNIIDAIRKSDPETGDLVLAGLITLSPPKLIERDERIFAIYGKREKTILSACYQILSREVDVRLNENCIGGRKGFSRHSFMDYLKRAKEQKLNWVVITDVKSFFASISHEILWIIFKERFRISKDVLKLLMDLLSLGAPVDEPKGDFSRKSPRQIAWECLSLRFG